MAEKKTLILIGAGSHAGVVACMASLTWNIPGIISNSKPDLEYPWLGADDKLEQVLTQYPDAEFVIAIGNNLVRKKLADKFSIPANRYATIIAPTAIVCDTAKIAPGTMISAGAIIQNNAEIGAHCIINTGSIVEHDCIIGQCAHIGPGVVMGGGCRIADKVFAGVGSRLKDHISIGADAVIGAGAVVLNDVVSNATVVGVPAREIEKRGGKQ